MNMEANKKQNAKKIQTKTLMLLAAVLVLTMAMLAGCGSPAAKDTDIAVDDSFLMTYVLEPEVTLGDRFVGSPEELSSQTLFDFFCLMVGKAENKALLPEVADDGLIHISTATIGDVLAKYFAKVNFDPTELASYNMAEDTVDIAGIPVRDTKVPYYSVITSENTNGQLHLVVEFYQDEAKTQVTITKDYIFQKTETGINYIKISQ